MSQTPLYDLAMKEFPKQLFPLLLWQGLVKQVEEDSARLAKALRQLSMAAQTAGGVAGSDAGLRAAIDAAEAALKRSVAAIGDAERPANKVADSGSRCDDCGCKLSRSLGGLESHAPGCANFPL